LIYKNEFSTPSQKKTPPTIKRSKTIERDASKKIVAAFSAKTAESAAMKYWEIIADNLSKAGWSWGCVSAVTSEGRIIWIADAHRDGKRFVVRGDEKLTAFIEIESAIRAASRHCSSGGWVGPSERWQG
jgi:hypothetical protein